MTLTARQRVFSCNRRVRRYASTARHHASILTLVLDPLFFSIAFALGGHDHVEHAIDFLQEASFPYPRRSAPLYYYTCGRAVAATLHEYRNISPQLPLVEPRCAFQPYRVPSRRILCSSFHDDCAVPLITAVGEYHSSYNNPVESLSLSNTAPATRSALSSQPPHGRRRFSVR